MIKATIDRLELICNVIPALLAVIDDKAFSEKPNPEKWSRKEIMGHLIDSAANNHQRFVRAQFEERPRITYDQENWNRFNYYQQISTKQIISLWTAYNKQLVELMRRIPVEHLDRECEVGDKIVTLEFLIQDYVKHLEHHLNQVINLNV